MNGVNVSIPELSHSNSNRGKVYLITIKYDFQFIFVETNAELLLLGVNMGYIENSYSNSNNGGSVNSQDSLYQMKMSAAAGNSGNLISQHHQYVERQPSYGYDPLTHGGKSD